MSLICSLLQCATKSVILHLQWTETEAKQDGIVTSPTSGNPSFTLSPPVLGRSRANPLAKSTSSVSSRRVSLNTLTPAPRGKRSSIPPTPSSPLTPLSRTSTPGPLFAVRYGQAAVLTAPPKLVAVVETPDVAVGAVDPRKRRVVTATRFSSRTGADRRVSRHCHAGVLE